MEPHFLLKIMFSRFPFFPQNMVLLGTVFQIAHYGPRDPNGLYGTQEAFGQAGFPPNPTRKWFYRDFPNFGKIGDGPLAPLYIPYWPFVGL